MTRELIEQLRAEIDIIRLQLDYAWRSMLRAHFWADQAEGAAAAIRAVTR